MTEHRPTRERRDEIIDAMIEAMAEHGYAKATIATIAEAADLTPGLLHYHFPSKTAILRGALHKLAAQQEELFQHITDAHDDALDALDAILVAMLAPGAQAQPGRVSAWVAILAEAIRQPDVAAELEEALMNFREHLSKLVAQAESRDALDLTDTSADALAAGLLALFQGYVTIGVTARAVVPRGSALTVARRMLADFRT